MKRKKGLRVQQVNDGKDGQKDRSWKYFIDFSFHVPECP